jgi:hypothetical protein
MLDFHELAPDGEGNFEITFRKVDRGHDAYDADHYRYYESVPNYV